SRWTATPGGLTALFIAGFLLRVLLGLGGGFPADTAIFQSWAARLAETGPGGFYAPGYFADYPPGYLYVLWPLGVLSKAVFAGVPPVFLVKLPGMVADVGLAYVVMALAATVASAAGVDRWWVRPAAAAAILFNPPVIFLSAVWGQVDTVAALYSLAAVLLIVRGPGSWKHEAGGAALLALAFATKPQTGFLVPVVGLVLIVRHLTRDSSARDRAIGLGVPPLAFLTTWVALGIPFGLGLGGLLDFYQDAGSVYPYTSVWAFNFWGIAGFWRPDSGVDAFRILGAPAIAVAVTAFGAGACYVLIRVFRALRARLSEAEVILAGGAAVVCLSFAVLTRIHERYLFLALACLAPLIVYPLVRALFAALALMFTLNLYFPWVYYVEQADRTTLKVDSLFRLFYGTANDSPNKKLLSLVTVAVCLLVAFKVWDFLKESAPGVARAEIPPKPVEDSVRPRWGLHPIGTRAAAIAGVLFLVLVPTRLAGLGTPQGMYFDEIYHARTAGEYLAGKESYEWTHPPLGKELMALSIDAFSGWAADEDGSAPGGMTAGVVDSDGTTVAWATSAGDGGEVHIAPLGTGCAVGASTATAAVPFVPSHVAVAASGGAFVAGTSGGEFVAARYTGSERVWQTPLDAAPVDIAAAGESLFVVDERGNLSMVGASGEALELSSGAAAVAFDVTSGGVWASFPNDRTVSAYDAQGTTLGSVQTYEGADDLVVVPEADRLLALDVDTGLLESVENEQRTWLDRMETPAQSLAATPDKGLAYAVDG
ncbi:MAG: PQQ-binding-like beta-propeller repeat protein, partial [Actinomycetota bacterium]|nr:PQQ-binding-like beta-propeller repeat protein [Actinomycetota bacterium]